MCLARLLLTFYTHSFLLPDVFSDVADFDAWFERQAPALTAEGEVADQSAAEKEAASNSVVKQLHAVLRPFLLRRVKADVEKSLLPKKEINVYVGMTALQRKWYKMILEKDIDAVNGAFALHKVETWGGSDELLRSQVLEGRRRARRGSRTLSCSFA